MTHSAGHDRDGTTSSGLASGASPWPTTAARTEDVASRFEWAAEPVAPRNAVLGALASEDFAALAPHLEPVALAADQVVLGVGSPGQHLYFPEAAIIAHMRDAGPGARPVCVATVGAEGCVGLSLFLGGSATFDLGVVLVGGEATRIDVTTLRRVAAERPAVHQVLDRHVAMTLAQLAQTAVCDRTHSVEQRLARLVLTARDQFGSHRLPLTHEALASVLGVRRASVTEAACALRRSGAIDYQRGRLVVRDGPMLVGAACGCYAVLRETFAARVAEKPLA